MIPLFTAALLTLASAEPGAPTDGRAVDTPPTGDQGGPSLAARPDPPAHTPVPVDAIRWAQPFSLQQEATWTMGAEPRPFRSGWLVEVAAPAALLQARAVGQQVLFANDTPVRPLHTPLVATCSVVVVPGDRLSTDVDLASVLWYFGSTELPERMDVEHGAWEQKVALAAGITPSAPVTIASAAVYDDLSALAEAAEGRFEACRAEGLDSTL